MKRRALLLTLSLVVALIGTVMIGLYVKGADDRAQQGQALVRVMVATGDIAKGTTAADVSRKFTFENVPQSAVKGLVPFTPADAAQLNTLGNRVTLIPIRTGQAISQTFFNTAQQNGAGVADASSDAVSFVFPLDPAARATGLITAGDTVTVLVTAKGQTKVFLPKAYVYAVNGAPAGSNDSAGSAGTVAVTVPIKDAERVVYAQMMKYDLYVVKAVNPDAVKNAAPVDSQNVFNP